MDRSTPEIDYQSLLEFRYAIQRFLAFSAEAARKVGFEPQQHQLMLAVKGLPDGVLPTVGNLAERLQIRHHSCVGLIDRLVASGHARRQRNEHDRREVLVHLTDEGEARLRELTLHHQEELRVAGPVLARALNQVLREAAREPARSEVRMLAVAGE